MFLFLLMALFAPLAVHVPMGALAAVLIIVAWNMSDAHRLARLVRIAPMGDRVVLVVTFALTVLVDLYGRDRGRRVLAAIVFMHRPTSGRGGEQAVTWPTPAAACGGAGRPLQITRGSWALSCRMVALRAGAHAATFRWLKSKLAR